MHSPTSPAVSPSANRNAHVAVGGPEWLGSTSQLLGSPMMHVFEQKESFIEPMPEPSVEHGPEHPEGGGPGSHAAPMVSGSVTWSTQSPVGGSQWRPAQS